jgi:hypothetical protein
MTRSCLAVLALTLAATSAMPLTPSPAQAPPLGVLSRVPADVSQAALDARLDDSLTVRAHVTPVGLVDSVRAVSGDPRLRADAEAAVRWWIFQPPGPAEWTTVRVEIDGRAETEALVPDVIAMARSAERDGDVRSAIDAWCGALARVGGHPQTRNEWAMRDRIVRLALRMPSPPPVPGFTAAEGQRARGRQQRTVARADHEDLVAALDALLLAAPWWSDAYQWRAASQLGCGQIADGLRSLVLFRTASRDSAARALADRALAGLARGDTLGVSQMLKLEGQQFNTDEDAR